MNLIFDFDGVICDSLPAVVNIAQDYLKEHHLEPIPLNTARTLGLIGLMKYYKISPLAIPGITGFGKKRMDHLRTTLPVFPDMPAVLTSLSKSHSLGIITNTSSQLVIKFLQYHKLDKLFQFVDDTPDIFGKHKKIRRHACDFYTGDMVRDIQAAKKAKVGSVAVTWGYEDETLLASAAPDYLVRLPSELLTIFQ